MRLLWVTDDRIGIDDEGRAFGVYPHTFAQFAEQLPAIRSLAVWSRRVRLTDQHDVSTMFPCPAQAGRCRLEYVGPLRESYKVRDWPLLLARNFLALRREVRRADIVYVRFPNIFSALAYHLITARQLLVGRIVGDPLETIPMLLPRLRWVAPILGSYCRKLAERADVCSFVSQALVTRYGQRCPRPLVTHNCLIRRHEIVRQGRVEPGTPPVVTYLGRLSVEKGVMVLIEAFALLPKELEARLDIVGDGLRREILEQRARELNVAERITWHGMLRFGSEPFSDAFRRSDVMVIPSFSEGLPRVVPEALSQGVPVVASAVGGIPEVLRQGEAGLLVPPGDVHALSAALRRVLTDRVLRERLITNGLESAAENCMENQTGRLAAEIAALLAGGGRGGGGTPRAHRGTVIASSPMNHATCLMGSLSSFLSMGSTLAGAMESLC